jgi:hypothetical protein
MVYLVSALLTSGSLQKIGEFMTNHKSFEEFESDPVIIFEEFLHMFFDGGGSEMPFDKEYYSSYIGSKKFKIVDEEGNICDNSVVYEALKPHLQKYGYQLTPDNFLVKKGEYEDE